MPKDWYKLLLTRLLPTILIIILAGMVMRHSTSQTPPTSTTTTTTLIEWNKENLDILIERIADEEEFEDTYLLKQLAYHESRYLKYPEVLEKTGWYSRGLLHYRTSTFLEQGIKYGVIQEGTTIKQALILIYNPELQVRIICRMGNDDRRLIRQHWQNSWNKIYNL